MSDDTPQDELQARRDRIEGELLAALADPSLGSWSPETVDPIARHKRQVLEGAIVPVPADQYRSAREAAAAAASAQRLLDRVHLEECVVHTDQGPAVLWSDILRVMPTPR